MAPRLKERYQKEIVPALVKEFGYRNPMAVPRLSQDRDQHGFGGSDPEREVAGFGQPGTGAITGQKPVITRARKSIANFKLRQAMPIGVMVTLRGDRMYEFFDRLSSVALPRVRDFRGLSIAGV